MLSEAVLVLVIVIEVVGIVCESPFDYEHDYAHEHDKRIGRQSPCAPTKAHAYFTSPRRTASERRLLVAGSTRIRSTIFPVRAFCASFDSMRCIIVRVP